tara:strand:+ start:270 stop:692 length:423 start_codon:yes stop_codon:yes gene_type:complete
VSNNDAYVIEGLPYWQAWETGSVNSMVAMPWSLGHPAIAYGIRMGGAEIKPDIRKPDIRELSGKGLFDIISKLLGITIVALIFASIFFPIQAFLFATNMANLLAGTSNGDEPLMLSPIFCIIPVLFTYLLALVIGKFPKK